VNWQHFRTVLWLRWRLRVNQVRRAGAVNAVLTAILAAVAVLAGLILFVTFLLVGWFAMAQSPGWVVMLVWDGLGLTFLFCWTIGLLVELQRSEALSLDKFLHLPVSLSNVFVINYLSSLFSISLIIFGPAMLGLAVGLVLGRGPLMLLGLPLVAAFVLMVTALTYQFQGWLASMMTNPRRRRAVIAVVTMVVVFLFQVPNAINMIYLRNRGATQDPDVAAQQAHDRELAALDSAHATGLTLISQAIAAQGLTPPVSPAPVLTGFPQTIVSLGVAFDASVPARPAGAITPEEYTRQKNKLDSDYQTAKAERDRLEMERAGEVIRLINLCVPPGWLPRGAADASEGRVLAPLLGTLGLALIGTASLWRAYRTTLRIYTGQYTARKRKRKQAAPTPVEAGPAAEMLLERHVPGVSEQAAAIALGGFRSLTRAPEVKMLLLTPFIFVLVFGSMLLTRQSVVPELLRPVMAFGALGMPMLTLVQLVGNQFGFDRGGFRVFVLCAAPRRDILLGKNLAVAPLALLLSLVMLVALQAVEPLRLDLFLAALPQWLSMYLLFCLLANLLAILAPMPVAAGSLKPAHPRLVPMLLNMLFVFLLPPVLGLTLLPLAVEYVLDQLGVAGGVPVCLILSLLECLGIVFFYRLALTWEGELFQAWEQKILHTVTTRAE
jgi:hypothetical protein